MKSKYFSMAATILALTIFISCDLFITELPWATGCYSEVPAVVEDITVTYHESDVTMKLDWEPVPGAQAYEITYHVYVGVNPGPELSVTISGNDSEYSFSLDDFYDRGARFGYNVTYKIKAINNAGEADASDEGTVKPLGDGSEGNPFRVLNLALLDIYIPTSNTGGRFTQLFRDIDVGGTDYNSVSLYDIFDGMNNLISSLDTRLFTSIGTNTVVKNLRLQGVVSGNSNTALLGGNCPSSSSIINCHIVNSTVTGSTSSGLLIGDNSGIVSNCTVDGSTFNPNSGSYNGLLIGSNNGTVTNCHVTNSTINGYQRTGGLIGSNSLGGSIANCSVSADTTVQATSSITGGFVGQNDGDIDNSISRANVNGSSTVGGFVGSNITNGSITNSQSYGNVSGGSDQTYHGSFLGSYNGFAYSGCWGYGTVNVSFTNQFGTSSFKFSYL